MSFQHFCRLDGALHIPDARTLWSFKQRLAQGGLGGRAIFEAVSLQLQQHGYIPRAGRSWMPASCRHRSPRRTRTSAKRSTKAAGPRAGMPKRLQHTDRDARWTKKHGKSFYGYKVHANADVRYKLIRQAKVTPANADDGQTLKEVLDRANTGARLLADHGPQEGTRLFCVVLDELRGVKLSVPRREMFFARLWKTERDALIQQLASRPGGDFTQADLAQMFGLSKPRISQLLGSPLNGKSC